LGGALSSNGIQKVRSGLLSMFLLWLEILFWRAEKRQKDGVFGAALAEWDKCRRQRSTPREDKVTTVGISYSGQQNDCESTV
jgi:hypothetical protein